METENKPALLNGNLVRAILILVALAAFVLAAGAPTCALC
jgi:hypothetical protein